MKRLDSILLLRDVLFIKIALVQFSMLLVFFSSEELSEEFRLSTLRDKLGNIYHCVDYINNNGTPDYVMFSKLSFSLDFIHSNFK